MTLTELLNNISTTKEAMRIKLGTSSYSLNQYPAFITNFLYTQYNNGYKEGWESVKGTAYSGNIRQLISIPSATVPTSWQGQDTTQLSTLVNVMIGIRDIRMEMRDALGIQYEDGCDLFAYYPNYLNVTSSHNSNSRADQEWQTGYAAGVQDATESTPQRVSTPIIRVVQGRDNVRNISSSNATSLRYWTSYTYGGQPIVTATTRTVSSLDYQIKQSDNGTYLCAIGMAANMVNSYTASALLSYVGTIPVNPPQVTPNVPEVDIDTNENKIYITSEQDVIIMYTTNGGTTWTNGGSNTVTINIRPLGYAAGNLQTYCYFPDNPSNPSATWSNAERIEYTLIPIEPEEDTSAVPFYIIGTRNDSINQYTIKATINRFHVSTTADFSSLVLPSSSNTDTWTLQTNTKYYIKKHFSSTDVPSNCSFKIVNPSNTSLKPTSISFGGNLLSLVDYNWESSSLTELPYGTSGCFRGMFTDTDWVKSIKDISKIYFPTIATGNYGYSQMFKGCVNITEVPTINAATISERGCYEMFCNCSGITKTGNILATAIAASGCRDMFYHCTNLVTGPSELKPLTLTDSCYYEMFDTCSKLVNAPKILATSISVSQCMKYMFYNCTALKSINVCFRTWSTSISSTGSTYRWCGGNSFSSSGTFTIEGRGVWNAADHVDDENGIPEGWEWIDNRGIAFEPSNPEINI